MLIKLFIVLALLTILAALGSGLYYLIRDGGQTDRTVKALSWRIGLSFTLFLLLMVLAFTGVIQPNNIVPS
jgi:hypothetical protein